MYCSHACTVAIVHTCTIAVVHACTIAVLHACPIVIVHACTTGLVLGALQGGGSGARSPPAEHGGLGDLASDLLSKTFKK